MLNHLWKHRSRHSFGSRAWCRAWAKRFLLLPVALRQVAAHRNLKRRGARISSTAFFSDAGMISGDLSKLEVGAGSFIGRVEISVHDRVVIGSNVCVNDGAKLLTASHDVTDPAWKTVSAAIELEDYSWICTNALVLPGVTVGRGAVVGAGAVVREDVSEYSIVAGNPARSLEKQRGRNLEYSPTSRLALFNAWVDNESHMIVHSAKH